MSKVHSKASKLLIISSCLSVFTATTAWAAPENHQVQPVQHVVTIDGVAISQQPDIIPPELLQKQREIDDYFAGEGEQELAERGFRFTHTVPLDKVVEIGILPYKEEYAEFLYEKFGREQVKVVEGEQAYLYAGPALAEDEEEVTIQITAADHAGQKDNSSLTENYAWGGAVVLGVIDFIKRHLLFGKK